jgi:hypothetical protein
LVEKLGSSVLSKSKPKALSPSEEELMAQAKQMAQAQVDNRERSTRTVSEQQEYELRKQELDNERHAVDSQKEIATKGLEIEKKRAEALEDDIHAKRKLANDTVQLERENARLRGERESRQQSSESEFEQGEPEERQGFLDKVSEAFSGEPEDELAKKKKPEWLV